MTTHQLATRLLAGPDCMVTINGYEDGVDEITHIIPVARLTRDAHDERYYGKHEYDQQGDILAVHLVGNPRD